MPKISRAEQKMAMREQAKAKIHGPKYHVTTRVQYAEGVEKGLDNLRRVGAEGGDSKAKKVKAELNYLLNNYLPRYDAQIETLIDEWRRTGDPSYDPGIKVRLRQARREDMSKSQPI